MIDWTILRKKFGLKIAYEKFEKLALLYVENQYPEYEWEQTDLKGDGNRDIHLKNPDDYGYDIWAEAKYRNSSNKKNHIERSLERKDIDSTILSGLICGKIELIIFISNAKLPNSVMNRSMLGARIKGIAITAVLAPQLENWLINNPDKYEFIFEEKINSYLETNEFTNILSIALYSTYSTDFSPINVKKEFYSGEYAILNIIVDSSSDALGEIANSNLLPFSFIEKEKFDKIDKIQINKGLTNLTYFIKMNQEYSGVVSINILTNSNIISGTSKRFIVHDFLQYKLIYYKQFKIENDIFSIIKNSYPYMKGQIITLYSNSGMGKSYVLNNIYQQFNMTHDITLIDFDSAYESLANYLLLCKTIIFLNYGNVFLNLHFQSNLYLKEFKKQILDSNDNSIFNNELLGKIIDGCFDANIAKTIINEIVCNLKSQSIPLISGRKNKARKILIIDDFQYLNKNQSYLIISLLEQIKINENNIIIIASATKNKFVNKLLEDYFLSLTCNNFILNGLSKKDKAEILKQEFNIKEYNEHISDKILPNSPLVALDIISSINKNIKKSNNTDICEVILSNSMYYNNKDSEILINKFNGIEPQYYLLDIIYRFKKGINKELLDGFFSEYSHYNLDIKLLVDNSFIIEEDDVFYPYHDYYINTYKKLRKESFDNKCVGNFLEYLLKKEHKNIMIDQNYVLSMILNCGDNYLTTYLYTVEKLIKYYSETTQFGTALYFCEFYYNQIKKLKPKTLTHNQAYYFYLYSDCLVHCGKDEYADELLNEIYNSAPDYSLEKYESGAGLINQLFWNFEPKPIISNSYYIQKGLEKMLYQSLNDTDQYRYQKTYDTCFNRRMVALLMLDEYIAARKEYINRLKIINNECKSTNDFCSCSATLIMDYSRNTTISNYYESKRLMMVALKFFNFDKQKHFRRIIICKTDSLVLSSICQENIDLSKFDELSKKLLDAKFFSEYFKTILKKSVCKIIDFASAKIENIFYTNCKILNDIKNEIYSVLVETNFVPRKRDKYLMNNVLAFINIINNNKEKAITLLNENKDIVKNTGKSYSICTNHNINHIDNIKTVQWYNSIEQEMEDDVYYIDARFW